MEVVERFAQALDCDRYDEAMALLEPDAVYDSGDGVTHGSGAIISSFGATSQWGRAHLDGLDFLHEIADERPLEIRFIDVLKKGGETFTARHTMHVRLSARGLIESLRLDHPEGQPEALKAFFARHGLRR